MVRVFDDYSKGEKSDIGQLMSACLCFFSFFFLQIEETGRGTVNTATQVTATHRGREIGIIPMTLIVIRTTTVIDGRTETPTAARAVTATTPLLEKDHTSSTATTGTTGVTDPTMTGEFTWIWWPSEASRLARNYTPVKMFSLCWEKSNYVATSGFEYKNEVAPKIPLFRKNQNN